jgi:predicted enzyme related to lactoylglutathione lyase
MKAAGFRIPVSDFDAAVAFYRDALGFAVDFAAEQYGWASISRDDLQLGLYVPGKGGGTRAPGGTVDFSIQVDDVDALHAELAELESCGGLTLTADGMRLFDITDPSGNVLTFVQG